MNCLATIKKKYISDVVSIFEDNLESTLSIIEIKCKARKNGITCNEVNQIEM